MTIVLPATGDDHFKVKLNSEWKIQAAGEWFLSFSGISTLPLLVLLNPLPYIYFLNINLSGFPTDGYLSRWSYKFTEPVSCAETCKTELLLGLWPSSLSSRRAQLTIPCITYRKALKIPILYRILSMSGQRDEASYVGDNRLVFYTQPDSEYLKHQRQTTAWKLKRHNELHQQIVMK